MINNRFL